MGFDAADGAFRIVRDRISCERGGGYVLRHAPLQGLIRMTVFIDLQ